MAYQKKGSGKPKDVRLDLTNRIIEILENGETPPWRAGWEKVAVRPFNPYSGTKFRGGNVLNLLIAQAAKGSIDPRWMTFEQIKKAGLRLNAGSTAQHVEYWNFYPKNKDESKSLDDAEQEEEQKIMFCRFYAEFNGGDIVGLPELHYQKPEFEPHEMIERLVRATGVDLHHRTVSLVNGGIKEDAAFYSHGSDKLVMPPMGAFKSADAYYATLLHELCHWTGHTDRLDRRKPGEERSMTSPEYAMEELRAEIGSCYLTAMFGLDANIESSAAYTAHYLNLMRDEKNGKHVMFAAARDAEKIIDYLFEFDPDLRNIIEGSVIADNLLNQNKQPSQAAETPKELDIPNFMPEVSQPEQERADASVKPVVLNEEEAWNRFTSVCFHKCLKAGLEPAYYEQILVREQQAFRDDIKALETIGESDVDSRVDRVVQGWVTARQAHQCWGSYLNQMKLKWQTDQAMSLFSDENAGYKAFLEGVQRSKTQFVVLAELMRVNPDHKMHNRKLDELYAEVFMTPGEPIVSQQSYQQMIIGSLPEEILKKWHEHYKINEADLMKTIDATPPIIQDIATALADTTDRYTSVDDDDDEVPVVNILAKVDSDLNGATPVFESENRSQPVAHTPLESEEEDLLKPLGNSLDLNSHSDYTPTL